MNESGDFSPVGTHDTAEAAGVDDTGRGNDPRIVFVDVRDRRSLRP